MKKIIFLAFTVALVSAGCAKVEKTAEVKVQAPPVQATTPPPVEKTPNWKNDAENVVAVFVKNINTPGYGSNIDIAFAQLSINAQNIVKTSPADGLASSMASFVGVQDAPTNGTSIIGS
jgi:uncharacterized protein YceK